MKTMSYVKFLAIATMCGCGLAPGDLGSEQQLGTASEALGETTCYTNTDYDVKVCPAPNGCPSTQPLAWTSPRTYSHPNCYKAVVADILYYDNSYTGVGDQPGGIYITWADAIPTTQSACVSAWIHADLYDNSQTKTGSTSGSGEWVPASVTPAYCVPPSVSFAIPAFPGNNGQYRMMASARTSSSSSAPTRMLRMEQRKPLNVR